MIMKNNEEKITDLISNLPDTKTVEKKVMKVATIILVIVIFLLVIAAIVMANAIMPVDKSNTEQIKFKVESGWGTSRVVEKLEDEHLIKNAFLVKLYLKFGPSTSIKEGTYLLNKSMSVEEIMTKLSSNDSVENEAYNIQFLEGKRFVDYVDQISETFGIPSEDIIAKTSDKEYLQTLIDKYWFLTDEILKDGIYYPLEGYLFADTYSIRKTATIEEIIETLLNEMDNKLSFYKDDIEASGKSIHSLLTLASMVELEAGHGKVKAEYGNASERELVASVFTNRLNTGMRLGSDVTTYYGARKTLQENINENLNDCNGYNTRGACVLALPVGPICTPSLSSILAAIKPANSNYLYFVADKKGELYFAIDQVGHNSNISYLQSHELWG